MNRRDFLGTLIKTTGVTVTLISLPEVWAKAELSATPSNNAFLKHQQLVASLIEVLTPIPAFIENNDINLMSFVDEMFSLGLSSTNQRLLEEGLAAIRVLKKLSPDKPIDSIVKTEFDKHKGVDAVKLQELTFSKLKEDDFLALSAMITIRDIALLGLFSHRVVVPYFTDNLFHAGKYQPCIDASK